MVLTPNMLLPESTINVDSGLTWEENLNSALTIIDGHSHAPGSGVQVTPTGLNINTDLTLNNNSLLNIGSLVLTQQLSLATVNAIYSIAGELYWNDGSGNIVQITSGGTVNATSSGISSGTSTASFVSSVLVVNAAPNTPANIQAGSILIGNNVAASKYLTLSPPSAMAANYTLTLPALPAVTGSFLTIDTSGNISSVTTVDNSTIQVSSNQISIKPQGVTQGLLAPRSTGTTVSAGGVAVSASSSNFSTGSGSAVAITNLSVTITTTGRPVFVGLIDDGAGSGFPSQIGAFLASGSAIPVAGQFFLINGTTTITETQIVLGTATASSNNLIGVPASSLWTLDQPAAGTYTYSASARVTAGGHSAFCVNAKLIAYEI